MASPDYERNLRLRTARELARTRTDPTDQFARKRLLILSAQLDHLIDKRGFWKRPLWPSCSRY